MYSCIRSFRRMAFVCSAVSLLAAVNGPRAMAASFDAASYGTAASGSTTVSFNHTLGTGANRLVVCGVSVGSPDTAVAPITVGVTFGGVAMNLAVQTPTHSQASTSKISGDLFYLNETGLGAASGSQVVVTLQSAPTGPVVAGCSSYFGMAQSAPTSTNTSYSGSTTAAGLAMTANSGDLIVDLFAGGSSSSKTASPGGGQTAAYSQQVTGTSSGGSGTGVWGGSSYVFPTTTGSTTVSWTSTEGRSAYAAAVFAATAVPAYAVTTNVNPVGGGTISLNPNQSSYTSGTNVTVTANPATYYSFANFSGDLSGTTNPQTLTVNANKSVTANFTRNQCTLTINVVGSGTTTPNSGTYDCGSTINLTATPGNGYSFANWSGSTGGYSGTNSSASFTLTQNTTETATFVQGTTCTLTTNVSGSGSISLNPAGGSYSCGTQVQVTAVPSSSDYQFTGFSGALTGTTNPQTLTLNANASVTATFTQIAFPVNVTVVGPGTVSLNPNQSSYSAGTQVTITATPSTGAHFVGYTGDLATSTNPATVTVNNTMNITATFAANAITLDSVSKGKSSSATNTISWTHTLGTGTQRAVVIEVGSADNVASPDANAQVTSVLFNGVYATPIPNSEIYGGTSGMVQTQLFYLTDAELPATAGNYTVQVNLTGAIAGFQGGAISLFGVNQGPPEAVVTHRDTTGADLISTSITTLTDNAWIIDVVEDNNVTSLTQNSGQTLAWTQSSTGLGTGGSSYKVLPAAGATTLGWAGSASRLAHSLAAFPPASSTTPPTYTLTTNVSPAGGGTVTSNPNLSTLPTQTAVLLTATPALGYSFSGWTGDFTSTSNPLQVVMDADHTVTANFVPAQTCTLTTTILGSGTVSPANGTYNCGTVITFTATPAAGYTFVGYSGDFTSSDNPADFTITANSNVTVEFDPQPQCTLTLNTVGSGNITPGSGSYACGTPVTLTATAGAGYAFAGFSGDYTGTNNPATITLDQNMTITGTFTAGTGCTLTTSVTGSGTVNPSSGTWACGTSITLQAVPATHYLFNGFSGDLTSASSPAQLTLNTNKNVVANFIYNTAGVTGDARTVTEPVYPPVCTKLTALMPVSSPNESSPDTARVQASLNGCASGQAVEFSSSGANNAFVIAPITLPAGVTMLLDPDVTILGSIKYADYTCNTSTSWCNPLINIATNADPAPGSAIMGLGVIDGRGNTALTDKGKSWYALGSDTRPRLIYIGGRTPTTYADNFTMYKVTLQNSPKFHVSGTGNNLTIWGVKIYSPPDSPNTDGIDPSGSKNITITNSYISDGDDMIAVKAGVGHVSNISIYNNHLYTGHGISVGSETNAGLNNMYVHDNAIDNGFGGSSVDSLRIKSDVSRGGEVYDVLYKNTCVNHGGDTLVFDPYYSSKSGSLIPNFHDITIQNFHELIRDSAHKVTMQGYNTAGTVYPLTLTLDNVQFDGATANDFKAPDQVNNAQITLGPGPVNIASFLIADASVAANNITIVNNVANSNPALDCSGAFVYLAGDLWTPSTSVAAGSSPVITAAIQNTVPPVVAGTISYPQNNKPTGTVTLLEGATTVGSGTINGRLATIAVPNITPGTHTYTARYGGDGNYSALSFGTITVVAASSTPVANNQSVNVPYNTATAITLTATGTGTLTYTVLTQPTNGTLSGTAPNLTYTPNSGYTGADSFTFKANNGTDSNTATVSINVLPAAPVANGQSVNVAYNTATTITLSATGSGTLTYSIVTQPAHGSLSGTAPNLTYTPTSGYTGADSFTFKANNGIDSNTATVSITVAGPGAAKLAFTAAPPTPIAAGANAGTITVAEETSAGTVITSAADSITLTVTGPGSYNATYTATASNGVATFNLSSAALTTAGTYTYTATSGALTAAQALETVNAGTTAGSIAVTGFPSPAQTDISSTVTVTVKDGYGNIATSFTGVVTLTSSDPLAGLPGSYTFQGTDAGVHVFTVTLNTAGTQSITATSGGVYGSQLSITVLNSIWVLNANGTEEQLAASGASMTGAGSAGGNSTAGALALDNAGNVWAVGTSFSGVTAFSRTGTMLSGAGGFSGGGISAPVGLALDGNGQVWVVNGNNTVSVLSSTGAAVTPNGGYSGVGLNTPSGVAVDRSGSVWVTNQGDGSVVKIIGAGAPVVTPLVTGTANNTLATKP